MINWEFVGVIVAIISLIFTLILEWPRLTSRFTINDSIRKIILRLVVGALIGLSIGLIVGWIAYKISLLLSPYFDLRVLPLSILLQRGAIIWVVGVTIINILTATRENIYSTHPKLIGRGLIFGFMSGLSVGLIALILFYAIVLYTEPFPVKLANIITDFIPTFVGTTIIGGVFGGLANQIAKALFITD